MTTMNCGLIEVGEELRVPLSHEAVQLRTFKMRHLHTLSLKMLLVERPYIIKLAIEYLGF